MGVIKDGTISGFLPSPRGFLVHYPGYPSSMTRAVETLGGIQGILKARSSQSEKLELHFRPEDPYSHPAFGELRPCKNFLLKISRGKPHDGHDAKDSDSLSNNQMQNEVQTTQSKTDTTAVTEEADNHIRADGEANLIADVVAHVPEAYCFNGMVDYQHVIPVHANIAQRRKRNWSELEEPHFEKGGLMGVDHEDIMLIVPPIFSPKDVPDNVVLRPPSLSAGSKKRQEVNPQLEFEMDIESVLALDFDIKEIPKIVNWEEYVPQGSDQWESQKAMNRLFDERPIWPKDSIKECLLDKGLNFSNEMLRRLLSRIAYYFSSGPFLRFWIKKGYDPRKDPDSRIYQRIDYRVPIPLRSYCDSQLANKKKHRWEDICAFRVFPCKIQTSLQLFELVDDYIQLEIKKPPLQATCTFATGWFSHNIINCFRQRLMMRFLSVFPKPGAESLLRAATSKFEKLKRDCCRETIKLDGEDSRQANSGLQENEEAIDAEDNEEDAAEANNSDEEWDPYDELDLAEDGEMPLPSHSYMNAENISRTHLQELFDSFPSSRYDADRPEENVSDEEYQIYEQDSDDSYSDE
ncbi:general transcription factor 3C polypeptide 5 isoform X2 [Neltuma alba]|nr:general transcription factor 3C polypeptide 5-like isoform X2 [Prosopis alba]XP_028758599.1 general transcription factor 3C polypeptide 5-like isoform X2 [Prosopis alba]XP_028758600.1 general transcription factor 3C polypeptide 5-like isoform X2 [Prosopis alba]